MKNIFALSLFLIISDLFAQDFTLQFKSDSTPFIHSNIDVYDLRVDGKLPVSAFLRPKDDFEELAVLGKPVDVEHTRDLRGETYVYIYDGLQLYFTDRYGEQELVSLKIWGTDHFLQVPSSEKQLRTDIAFLDLIYPIPERTGLRWSEINKVPIDFSTIENEGYDGWFTLVDGMVREILVYY